MITAKPTEHLAGVLLEGEYDDLYEMVESIYRITGLEYDYNDPFWSVKDRLLRICYDIRHAFQGDRKVKLADNGVHDELMKWHSMIMPLKNLHYTVEILFPEAVFVALSVPEMFARSSVYYGSHARKMQEKEEHPLNYTYSYSDYIRDQAMMNLLVSIFFSAFAEVIGDEEFEKIIHMKNNQYGSLYMDYAAQYLDRCNIDYLKTDPEKRKDKLRNIAKRLIRKPDAYNNMKFDLEYAARMNHCSIHELRDPKLKYPDVIEW